MALFSPLCGMAQVNLDSGLIAYYPFSEGANDESGNNYHGTLLGEAFANQTLVILPNDSNVLELPAVVMDGLTDFTISCRVKFYAFNLTANNTPRNWLISGARGGGGVNPDNALTIEYTHNQEKLGIRIEEGNRDEFSVSLETDTWYCLIVSRSGNQVEMTVNGLSLGSKQTTTQPVNIDAGGLFVGQDQDCLGGCFDPNQTLNGELDELRFYNRVLSTLEKTAICQSFSTGLEVGAQVPLIWVSSSSSLGYFRLYSPQAAIRSLDLLDLSGRYLTNTLEHGLHEAWGHTNHRGWALIRVRTDRGVWVQKIWLN